MEFRAIYRYARISPRKARLVVELIRGRPVNEAKEILSFTRKRAAFFTEKVLNSAIANAEDLANTRSEDIDTENLYVKEAVVDEGPRLKRWLPRARGHATPIIKRTCHIRIVLEELSPKEEELEEGKEKKTLKSGGKKASKGVEEKGKGEEVSSKKPEEGDASKVSQERPAVQKPKEKNASSSTKPKSSSKASSQKKRRPTKSAKGQKKSKKDE
ncbi:MAG: 50S ribosomal protein L22 [Planctomycetota bacterium]|nr:MAG: 50S ribosomal protein L22 [Planctomycetota bacterium]